MKPAAIQTSAPANTADGACTTCGSTESLIIEVRGTRRRRQCTRCPHRWTTFEVPKERLERLERLERAVTDAMETTG